MGTDRKGTPKEMKQLRDQEEKSTRYCHSKDKLLLVSYVDKKKTGKKM